MMVALAFIPALHPGDWDTLYHNCLGAGLSVRSPALHTRRYCLVGYGLVDVLLEAAGL
jgi:hypothetical protein